MSGSSSQRTLFQTWGSSVSQNEVARPRTDGKPAPGRSSSSAQRAPASSPAPSSLWATVGQTSPSASTAWTGDPAPPMCEDDEDDDLMLVAVYEAERTLQTDNCLQGVRTEDSGLSLPASVGQTYPDFPGFDSSSAKVWIYPTNYPIREYQLKISQAALFQNTLVCLPTGLGKTFIAAVVMYNFYRWYPCGKIVFMAPTKPLVAQQIEACYKVMGIPQAHMAELTGSTAAKHRQEVWRSKRVFFLTPQVMMNDLSRDTCPAQQIKCVVIDEAHKGLGNHAYCQVVRQLYSQTQQFRILALSATPGGDTKSVQSVISNLLISHIELRSEESPDIQAHSHQRSVEKVVVPLGEVLSAYQARYLQVLEKFMSRLVQNRVMAHKDLRTLTKYQLILARDQFRKNPPPSIKGAQQGVLEGDFALCISLYHGYEMLMQMGLRSLFFYVQGIMDGSREMSRARNELQRTPTFMDLYHEMEAMFAKPSAGPDDSFIYSHPKLEKLEEVMLQHFRLWKGSSAESGGSSPQEVSTRVMIFSSFRESVQEIAVMLNRHAPLIRVMTFMGQASAGKGVKGFTQKEQLEVVHRFRQGGFNTLVSTCVGEEGLDIGEVDLIACFDAQKNPIRLVQRMGRTGRKRRGRIVVVLAEGREERTYNQSQSNKRSVYKSITSNRSGFHMYPNSPRMLPDGVHPILHKMHITCGQFDHRGGGRRSARGRRSHSEGRASLIHPQNLLPQNSAPSDGFLNCTEYSQWASTMRLGEQDAHPRLKQSHFLSIPDAPPPQEEVSEGRPPSRELSLWEWRLWQHKPLPTDVVDHSLRCSHFIQLMKLMDNMKEENEGECRYEQELLPYRDRKDSLTSLQRKSKATKIRVKSTRDKLKTFRSSFSELEAVEDEVERESTQKAEDCRLVGDDLQVPGQDNAEPLSPKDIETSTSIVECQEIEDDAAGRRKVLPTQEIPARDQDVELNAMFYLPDWVSGPTPRSDKLLPERSQSLKLILDNVEELLSRSPPPLADIGDMDDTTPSLWPPNRPHHQMFPVTFDLSEEDEEEVEMIVDPASLASHKESHKAPSDCVHTTANSPAWDDLFEDEDVHTLRNRNEEMNKKDGVEDEVHAAMDENIDIKRHSHGVIKENSHREDSRCATDDVTKTQRSPARMDESIDLFGDDEAFLQMTIPDIPTPEHTALPPGCASKARMDTDDTERSVKPLHRHNTSDSYCSAARRSNTIEEPVSSARRNTSSEADRTKNSSKTNPHLHITTADLETDGHPKGLKVSETSKSSEASNDFFPVNFDLGYSLEDSDEEGEAGVEAVPADPRTVSPVCEDRDLSNVFLPVATNSSTPHIGLPRPRVPGLASGSTLSAPQEPSRSRLPLLSPITAPAVKRTLLSCLKGRPSESASSTATVERMEAVDAAPLTESNSDSEDDVPHKRRRRKKVNPMSSPEVSKLSSDPDSPVVVNRKRTAALNTSEETEMEAVSDDDFQNDSTFQRRASAHRVEKPAKAKHTVCGKGREFLDEEAVLTEDEEGAAVSSDEEEGEEHERFLKGFVDDNTHLSQGLDDSEMHGVYLKSVRSPAVHGKYKMSYRKHHDMDIFSQVPELDETYAEDSFVVGSDEEEPNSSEPDEPDEPDGVELLPEASYVDGRKQYATRRRVFLHKARTKAGGGVGSPPRPRVAAKRSRVIRVRDSSEDETEGSGKQQGPAPPPPEAASSSASTACKAQALAQSEERLRERNRLRLETQHRLSNQLDFADSNKASPSWRKPVQEIPSTSSVTLKVAAQDPSASESPPSSAVSILVDGRCLSSGVDLMTSLRRRHAAAVHVCSLESSYFIVSSRMAVERHAQSDLAAMQNRKRLAERVSSLQALFERVCLIVEKDRSKTGDTSRPFQRTRVYDSTLAALVNTGVRLLWSDGAEESAGLLAGLARLEQRKGQGISVPLEVKGQHKQQALQLYLSLPSINYIQALNMSHHFLSVAQLMNSSIDEIQKKGRVSRPRAEEIYRFVRYSCDSFLVGTAKAGKHS